jgi:hypothetical protein
MENMETKLVSQLLDSLDIEPSQIFRELSVSHPLLNIMPPKLHVQSPVRKKLSPVFQWLVHHDSWSF